MDPSLVRMFPQHFDEDETLWFIEEEGLESDSFEIVEKSEEAQILRNIDDHVLVAHPTDQVDAARFEIINNSEMRKVSGNRFKIHSYKDTLPRGLPVAFSTQWNNMTYCMYVERRGDNMRVAFKSGSPPRRIDEATSDILFFKTQFSKGSWRFYKFESTLEEDHFLAFEKDKTTNISRLIVKKTKAKEKVDETVKIYCYAAS